jgi:transcriptional regulator with XRE-family HTH domain
MKTVNINDCDEKPVFELLRNLRRSMDVTQDDVASKMGTSKSNISRLEKNIHSPTLRTLKQYLNALGGVELQIVFNGE